MFSFKRVIWALAFRNFQARFIGTGAGILWTVVHPLADGSGVLAGLFAWIQSQGARRCAFRALFHDGTVAMELSFGNPGGLGWGAVIGNQHLVKKMVFPTETLPVVEILAATFSHLMLLGCTFALLFLHGIFPGWATLQLAYAYLCGCALTLGSGWALIGDKCLSSRYRTIPPDCTELLVLGTPVVWDINMLP